MANISLYNKIASIRPVRPEHLAELTARAVAKKHHVLAPTSIVMKNGQISGYISIGMVPNVLLWLDDDAITPRDSVHVFGFVEDVMAHYNVPAYAMPTNAASPFNAIAQDAGFLNTGLHTMFVKPLTRNQH